MQNLHTKLIILFLTLHFAGAAVAQNEVFLTMDPTTSNPTVVSEPSASAVLVIRSLDYLAVPLTNGMPEPFILVFESSFGGQFNNTPGLGFSTGTETASGWVFQSEVSSFAIPGVGNVPAQQVRIRLTNGAGVPPGNPAGFKYDVLMGGKVIDPRIRPR